MASLLGLRVLIGLVIGVSVTLAFSLTVQGTAADRRGATLGLLSAGISYGSFLGFVVAGALGTWSLTWLFWADAVALLLVGGLVWAVHNSRRGPETLRDPGLGGSVPP